MFDLFPKWRSDHKTFSDVRRVRDCSFIIFRGFVSFLRALIFVDFVVDSFDVTWKHYVTRYIRCT